MTSTAPTTDLEVVAVHTPGLGNHAYLLASGGEAVVVDPPRDGWRLIDVVDERGWRLTHAVETHVHNDYLSGARELRQARDAAIVAPADGRYLFPHEGAREGSRLELGTIGLVARATPGHTPEHLSWEVQDGAGRPVAVFTGGSLLIGGVGRTDLLGARHLDELTEAQFRTMRRLAELPDDVRVYPTHGSGSFCVAGDSDGPSSATIGALRRWNPAFAAPDLAAFEAQLAAGRTLYPAYYRRMAPLNRRGPRILGGPPEPHPLTAREVAAARDAGVWLIDVRDRWAFAERHIRGSWNIELGDSLVSYVGWLLPFDAPMCLVVDDPEQEVETATELLRIGYDHVLGHLYGGLDAWAAWGGPTSSYPTTSWTELRDWAAGDGGGAGRILDVRQPYEWRQGAIPGSRRIFVADLPEAAAELDRDGPWLVACRTGVRSAIAASILDASGVPVRLVTDGGVPALPADELPTGRLSVDRSSGAAPASTPTAARPPRLLAMMGSGETAPPMARVHRALAARLAELGPARGVVLDTPYAFQENVDEISRRAVEYFARHVGLTMDVAAVRDGQDRAQRAAAMAALRRASLIFCGPGSPSYALRVWRESDVPALLADRLATGGPLTFASAAALTLGARTVPVYEIYKVGEPPRWLPGLDLLGPYGLPVAVIPHYDNAEGGTHDTRFCYLGARHLAVLEAALSDDEFVLGIDSHTALILDLETMTAAVEGLGGVTVRAAGRSEVIPAGTTRLAIGELPRMAARLRRARSVAAPSTDPSHAAGPADDDATLGRPAAPGNPLAEAVRSLEDRFDRAMSGGDREAALRAVLELDELLVAWSGDTDGSGDTERARQAFTGLVTRLAGAGQGSETAPGPSRGIVDLLIDLRARARAEGDWATADRIRDALAATGIEVRDLVDGTVWQRAGS